MSKSQRNGTHVFARLLSALERAGAHLPQWGASMIVDPRLLREPRFPVLRAIRDCDRREHVAAQVAAGVSRDAAERHAEEEAAFDLPDGLEE